VSGNELSLRGRWTLAVVAMLVMAVSYVDRQTLAVLAPTVRQALHLDAEQYGWLLAGFSFAYLVGAPLAGWLIDRVGARRGLLGAVLVWSLVAAVHAAVPTFGVLLALRVMLGLAEAPSFPGAAQTVHRALRPEERARGMGVLFTGSSLGAAVAVLLAPGLEARWGFRKAFLMTAMIGLIWVPLWLATAWSAAARRALDREDVRTDPASPAGGLAGRLAVVAHPAVLRTVVVVLASAPAVSFVLNWMAEYLVRTHHVTQTEVRGYLWLPPLLFDLGAVTFGHLASLRFARRRGAPERTLLAMAGTLCSGLVLLPLVGDAPWPATLVAGVSLAGGGGLYALITADMLMRVSPRLVASAGGIAAAAQSIAYVAANPLIGRSFERTGGFAEAAVSLGVWVVPGCLAWLLWTPPPPAAEVP
jgi:ACS family hexuronate transporter-like MFS transporter